MGDFDIDSILETTAASADDRGEPFDVCMDRIRRVLAERVSIAQRALNGELLVLKQAEPSGEQEQAQ